MKKIITSVVGATSLAALGVLAPAGVAHAATQVPAGAKYYVALGDSLSQGYQPTGPNGQGVETDQGYVDDIYATQYANDADLQLVKLGCPGETTTTMLQGGICPTYKSQEDAATTLLKKYGSQVSFVTLDIGANNVDNCVTSSGAINGPCLQAGEKSLAKQLPIILKKLQAADPGVAIYGMNYYDPFLALYLEGTQSAEEQAESSVQLTYQFNTEMDDIYSEYNVPVADVATAFETNDSTFDNGDTVNGMSVPDNVGAICQLTWMCTNENIHANAQGYQVIANTFEALDLPD